MIKVQHKERIKRDRQHERALRSAQVLQSFASGFTLRPVAVQLLNGAPAPAMSSSNRIYIDEVQLADLTTAIGVASLKGLTIHEIAHILLTPRSGHDLVDWLMEVEADLRGKYKRAWNALEDQRIESALVASYPAIKPWLQATIEHHILTTNDHYSVAFPLTHGRKYLDSKVRRLIREVYIKQDDVVALSAIIDEYRTLNMADDADVERAKVLVQQYSEYTEGIELPDPNGHDSRPVNEHETSTKSRPWDKKKQKDASDKVREENEQDDESDIDIDDLLDDLEDSHPDPSANEDDLDGEDADFDGEGGEPIEDDGDGSPSDSDSDGDSEASDGKSDSDADKDSKGAGKSDLEKALDNLLEKSLKDTLERLEDKIANDIDLYNGDVLLEGEEVPEPPRYSEEQVRSVGTEAGSASEAFAQTLRQLRNEQAPAWNRRVATGRINPARWESGCQIEEAFDRWEEGHDDATDIECVILLDVSGSMSSEIHEAHESMWAIKNALDSIQASTSVLAYHDSGYFRSSGDASSVFTLYSAEERVGGDMKVIPALGGTDPFHALQYAKYLLAKSTRAIKLLIIITDGAWNGKVDKSEEIITDIRGGGVITSLAYLSSWHSGNIEAHGCEIASHINEPSALFHLGQAIVEMGIARQLSH